MILKKGILVKEIDVHGWNWGAFLIGPLWYMCTGLVGRGFLYLFLIAISSWTVIVPFILLFVMGAKYNSEKYEQMLEHGWEGER